MQEILDQEQQGINERFEFPQETENTIDSNLSSAGDGHTFTEQEWIEANKNNPDFNPEHFKDFQEIYRQSSDWRSERHKKRDDLPAWFKYWAKYSPLEIAREHAERENKYWDKRYVSSKVVDALRKPILDEKGFHQYEVETQAEYRKHLERLQVTINRMNTKRDNPDSEKAKNIHIMVLDLGGGMGGANGAGQSMALHELGYFPQAKSEHETAEEKAHRRVIDFYYGISTGAAIGLYTVEGYDQTRKGTSIFYDVCPGTIDLSGWPMKMDIDAIAEEMRTGKRKVDEELVRKSATELWVQVADTDGEPKMVKAADVKEGPIQAVKASIAMPFAYDKTVEVNGEPCIDGGIRPLPLEMIRKNFPTVTDILIKPQIPFKYVAEFQRNFVENLLYGISKMFPDKHSSLLIEKIVTQPLKLREIFEKLEEITGIHISVLWPPDTGVSTLSNDPAEIKAAAMSACAETLKIFGEPGKIKNVKFA